MSEVRIYNISEGKRVFGRKMLREAFRVVSGEEVLGTWYPGGESLPRTLGLLMKQHEFLVEKLEKVIKELTKK